MRTRLGRSARRRGWVELERSSGPALFTGGVYASRQALRDENSQVDNESSQRPGKSFGRSRSLADMKTSSLAYRRQRQSKGGTRVRKLLISASVEKPAALCGWISGIAITSTASPTCNGRSTTAGHGSHIPGILIGDRLKPLRDGSTAISMQPWRGITPA